MIQLIKTTGEIINLPSKKLTLEELQTFVGGYIELVKLNREEIMVVNEDGKLYNLPVNIIATTIYQKVIPSKDVIVGDVIICNDSLIN